MRNFGNIVGRGWGRLLLLLLLRRRRRRRRRRLLLLLLLLSLGTSFVRQRCRARRGWRQDNAFPVWRMPSAASPRNLHAGPNPKLFRKTASIGSFVVYSFLTECELVWRLKSKPTVGGSCCIRLTKCYCCVPTQSRECTQALASDRVLADISRSEHAYSRGLQVKPRFLDYTTAQSRKLIWYQPGPQLFYPKSATSPGLLTEAAPRGCKAQSRMTAADIHLKYTATLRWKFSLFGTGPCEEMLNLAWKACCPQVPSFCNQVAGSYVAAYFMRQKKTILS